MLVLLLINTMELSTAEQELPAPQLSLGAPDYRPPVDFAYRCHGNMGTPPKTGTPVPIFTGNMGIPL